MKFHPYSTVTESFIEKKNIIKGYKEKKYQARGTNKVPGS